MADDTTHAVAMESISRKNELTNSDYICVQCIELKNQLKETVEELKSARLIIELLQQESSTRISSNQDDVNHSLTHSWSRALLEKPPIVQLLENFPA
jgi:hypothetical protein